MGYKPTLSDTPEIDSSESYTPTLEDTPNISNDYLQSAKDLGRNVSGGFLSTISDLAKSVPDLNTMVPDNFKNILPYQQGQRPADNFDPYAAVGTTNQPINSLAGLEQTAGSLFAPGKLAKESIGLTKNLVTNYLNRLKPESLAKTAQLGHDTLEKSAIDLFDKVGNLAKERGVNIIPFNKNIINELYKKLPNTEKVRNLIEKFKSGDYQALRDMQAELWHRGTGARKSPLKSDQYDGEELLDIRNKINNSISQHFKNTGHTDLADLLTEAKQKYKLLKDTYYSKYVPNAVKRLVHPESREIPSNPVKLFSKQSDPMDAIREHNPQIGQFLKDYEGKENALKKLKYLAYGAGGLTGLGVIGSGAYTLGSKLGNKISSEFD